MLGPGGVKSLSSSSPLFGSKDDYWRGKAWMNMNYLLVEALEHYAAAPLPEIKGGVGRSTEQDAAGSNSSGVLSQVFSWFWGAEAEPSGPMSRKEWAHTQQDAAAAAARIRQVVVSNMVDKYEHQGSLFENYEADHGLGRGTAPFTGWTGAVLPLLSGGGAPPEAAGQTAQVGADGGASLEK
jgi:hypothetical protein